MTETYILLVTNSNDPIKIIDSIKEIIKEEKIQADIQGVYGVYDIVVKLIIDGDGDDYDYDDKINQVTDRIKNIDKVMSILRP